jgi:endonuclease/exonuclease/phosphatase family metal-dependent hydrolase
LIAALALGALAVVVADGARRQPADPSEILTLRGEEHVNSRLDEAPTLRIGTFNIHAGVGRDGKRDLHRTADCLTDLDVVALQEVRVPLLKTGGPQAREISDTLGMAWLFVPAERRWWHNEYGTAILTRTPLEPCCRIPLPTPDRRSFRTALLTSIRHRGRVVNLLAVHLDKEHQNSDRDAQVRLVCDLFRSLNGPSILFGDLNTSEDHPEIIRLLSVPGVRNAMANVPRTGKKDKVVDWIITKEFKTVHGEWDATIASDHHVARAEIALVDSHSTQCTALSSSGRPGKQQ